MRKLPGARSATSPAMPPATALAVEKEARCGRGSVARQLGLNQALRRVSSPRG